MISEFIYCTYITFYRGKKLPQFYIGSSSIEKVKNGYHGSVSSKKYKNIWKNELKENSHLFETKIISTHRTRQEAMSKEEFFHRQLDVIKSPLYCNMAFANKVFDSTILCGPKSSTKGLKRSSETKQLMSRVRKNSDILKKISIKNLPIPQKGILNGMHKSNRNYDSDKEKNRIKNIKISKENRTKEQNVTSYSRLKSLEEIQKMKESMKNRRTVYISRLSDRKVMDIGNYTKWLKTL